MTYRCIDVETTGLPSDEVPSGMMEVGWCDLRDGAIGAPQATLVNCGIPVSIGARAIHHISDEMVAGAIKPDEACMLAGAGDHEYVCAHNVDHEKHYVGAGERKWLCTYKTALRIWPDAPGHKLMELRYFLKLDDAEDFDPGFANPPHRARADVYVCAHLLRPTPEGGRDREDGPLVERARAALHVLHEKAQGHALARGRAQGPRLPALDLYQERRHRPRYPGDRQILPEPNRGRRQRRHLTTNPEEETTMSKAKAAAAESPKLPPTVVMMPIDQLMLAAEAPKEVRHLFQVRKSKDSSPMSDAELKSSIYAHGVIVPMVVKRHATKSYVIAGNRRLRLLREIFADAPASPAPTIDADTYSGDPREIAMATNIGLPQHPADRYEIIAQLVKEGMTPADAKARFGLDQRQYQQTMRLGKASPAVRDEWREGKITADVVQALMLSDDPKEQDRVLAASRKSGFGGRVTAHDVRSRLVGKQQDAGRFVEFVGLAECIRGGLSVNEDLFGGRAHTVDDMKLLRKLVDQKLKAACSALVLKGWAWALPEEDLGTNSWSYGRIEPAGKTEASAEQKRRMEEITATIAAGSSEDLTDAEEALQDEHDQIEEDVKASGFTDKQRAKAGCILKISHEGKLQIEYGRVKPEERKRVEASEKKAAAPATKAKAKKPGEAVMTAALAQRLSEQLQEAGGRALKLEHGIATSALIAALATGGHVLDVRVAGGPERSYGGVSPSTAKNFISVFEGALKATAEQRQAMLAQAAAQALSIIVYRPENMPLGDPAIARLFAAFNAKNLGADLRDIFDAGDYFKSVSTSTIVEAVRCSVGAEHADKLAKAKKADAAKWATANVPATGWLPRPLRTAHYDGPTESAPAKKAAKAPVTKPVKKAAGKKAAKKAKK